MNVVLFSTGCPKCNVLKQKLDDKGISYILNEDVNHMLELGIMTAPMLSVDGELLPFIEAVEWVNEQNT